MNFLVLAAGSAILDTQDGNYPFCLSELEGVPLIERIITACQTMPNAHIIVALREEEVRLFHLDNIVKLIDPSATIIRIKENTAGAACTALLAANQIDTEEELIILNGNELIDEPFQNIIRSFRDRSLTAGTVTFPSIHPRYSYVRLGEDDLVVEAAEKRPISRLATVGFYWFAHGLDFVRATKNMIRKNAAVNGLFYICPTLNQLILEQKPIGIYPIDTSRYHPFKTERQLLQYENTLDEGRLP